MLDLKWIKSSLNDELMAYNQATRALTRVQQSYVNIQRYGAKVLLISHVPFRALSHYRNVRHALAVSSRAHSFTLENENLP